MSIPDFADSIRKGFQYCHQIGQCHQATQELLVSTWNRDISSQYHQMPELSENPAEYKTLLDQQRNVDALIDQIAEKIKEDLWVDRPKARIDRETVNVQRFMLEQDVDNACQQKDQIDRVDQLTKYCRSSDLRFPEKTQSRALEILSGVKPEWSLKIFQSTGLVAKHHLQVKRVIDPCTHEVCVQKSYLHQGRQLKEYQILQSLPSHPAIIQMEYAQQGSLFFKYLEGSVPFMLEAGDLNALGLDNFIDLIYQLALTIQHLHRHDVVHADLHSNNILIVNNNDTEEGVETRKVVLIDFGEAFFVDHYTRGAFDGNKCYHLPLEYVQGKISDATLLKSIDIYSFGYLVWWHLCRNPFPDIGVPWRYNAEINRYYPGEYALGSLENQLIPEVKHQVLKEKIWLLDLVRSCLAITPDVRPSIGKVVEIIEKNDYRTDL